MSDAMRIPALSLTRPWTTLVLRGIKPVENRTWSTPYRGPLIIHGAKSWDDEAWILAEQLLDEQDVISRSKTDHPTGFLGVVDLVDVCVAGDRGYYCDCGSWAFLGQCHWKVANARRFAAPIPGNGRLGLFAPPDDVLAASSAVSS